MSRPDSVTVAALVSLMLGGMIGFAAGGKHAEETCDQQLVNRGLKAYNATTGVLEWTKKAEAE